MIVVDSHEDLACKMIECGRDYTLSVTETRAREMGTDIPIHDGTALLGWPEWVAGRVGVIFTTLFAAPFRRRTGWARELLYADEAQANRLYWEQVEIYRRLFDEHEDKFAPVRTQADLEAVLATWEGAPPLAPRVGLVMLMEGADAVRDPDELPEWYEAGVRILGPAWVGTRYAGGTHEPGGFSRDGFALMEVMAELGMILDTTHLAEQAAKEALDRYEGVLIASHSNARALIPQSDRPDRHLSDDVIRGLAERQGVIGIVPYNLFLKDGWTPSDGRLGVTIDHVVAHIDHICQLVGSAAHVGLGSDFDGGFGLEKIPEGLDSVADLRLIGEALRERGFSPADVEAVLGGNWLRILRQAIPEN